jgi:hypothetical protein
MHYFYQKLGDETKLVKSSPAENIELSHRALLMTASIIVKTFLMAIVSTQIFCGGIDPNSLFVHCGTNVVYVGGSTAAVAISGALFGYYIIRIAAFKKIFPRMMKADFVITAMYFAVAFSAPALIAGKIMIWLFGTWILGMLLSPFNSERTTVKKITEYGSLIALGALLTAHFVPIANQFSSSYTLGMMVSSITGIFGAGREK